MRRNAAIALCTGLAALALAAPAAAASGSAAIADCEHNNRLTGSYSTSALQNALATMPANVQEYTNCVQVIQQQLLQQAGSKGGGGSSSGSGSGSSFLPTPVIVIIVVLALGAITFGAFEVRRRRASQ